MAARGKRAGAIPERQTPPCSLAKGRVARDPRHPFIDAAQTCPAAASGEDEGEKGEREAGGGDLGFRPPVAWRGRREGERHLVVPPSLCSVLFDNDVAHEKR
jgi:hypothetical protein